METRTRRIRQRLEREGWILRRHGGNHDIYTHPARPNTRIVVPRHRTVPPGTARSIAQSAGWVGEGG
ncbi:MAG: type II toxin-antitoxin system HicA family toxin [Chloroflexota bacterium]|nr:type II toxin-antitoxin system HicA family toxin [Chloroflexota bacterium]MXY80250.1 type II toxin-antitoxin system HicA family toxin [Chloroflexota bacterium]